LGGIDIRELGAKYGLVLLEKKWKKKKSIFRGKMRRGEESTLAIVIGVPIFLKGERNQSPLPLAT